ncbi:MAG: TonB-dependent receptor [Maricaulaceae bacterium]
MKMTYKAGLSTASVLALSFAMAVPASAQLDEIIVTAQKREQSLQDVPIAVTAVNADYIESRNITDIQSLSSLAPNLKIENTPGNTTAAQISIRGGVTINPALSWEPTVGIYLNGAYIGKTQGAIFDVADIERLEVLRGPQGTLYGRNTLAGAVNVITAKPTEEFGGKLKVGYGNYNARMAKGTVNFGQIGPVRAKVSAMIEKRDGFVDGVANPFPGVTTAGPLSTDEFQSLNKKSFLLGLSSDLSENISLDYTFDYSDADQDPTFSQIVSVSPQNIFDPAVPFYVGGGPFGGQYFGFPLDLYVNADRQDTGTVDGPVFEKSRVEGHNLTATFNTGIGEIKSITSKRHMSWDDALDLDGSPLPLAHTQRLSSYDSLSQEFQLTGETGEINYVLGAYYFEDDGDTKNPQTFFGGANRFDSRYGFETDAIALYGQIDFDLTESLSFTGGLRYTEEEKSIDRANLLLGSPDIFLVPAGTKAKAKFDNVSPQVTINYEVNDNIKTYAKYAKGFKSGGFNGEAGSVVETTRPYKAETINSFEIGAKTRFLDNRAQLNGAVFINQHKDMQLSVFTAQGAAASDIRNAGRAEIKGLELEGMLQATDNIIVRGSLGLMDVEYKEFIEFGTDVADDRAFPHAPKTTASVGVDWDVMKTSWGTVALSADVNHSAKYFTYPYSLTLTAPQHAFNTQAPSRTLVDGRLSLKDIEFAGKDVELAIWGKNIFDKEYLTNFIDFGPGFGGLTNGYFGAPATYGISLGIDF